MGKTMVIAIVLVLVLAVPATANSFSIIPQGDWVYGAVTGLSENHFLPLAFSTDELNRYEVALILAGILQFIDLDDTSTIQRFGMSKKINLIDMINNYNQLVDEYHRLGVKSIDILRRLALEFQTELTVLGYAVKEEKPFASSNNLVSQRAEQVLLAERDLTLQAEVTSSTQQELKGLWIPNYPVIRPSLWEDVQHTSTIHLDDLDVVPLSDLHFDVDSLNVVMNSLVPVGDDLLVGARFVKLSDSEENPKMAGLAGTYLFNDDVSVEGQYLHNTHTPLGSGFMQVGATVRLGELEVGGSLHALQSGYQPVESEVAVSSGSGYEFSFRFGELLVSTGRDKMRISEPDSSQLTTTNLDVRYGLPNMVLVSAGYRQVDSEFKSLAELGSPASTSLGLDIPIPQGRLRLGLTSEWMAENSRVLEDSGQGNQRLAVIGASEDSLRSESSSAKKTALVGLSYVINNETSLQLNYKLIDFDNMDSASEPKTNMATAEFSIRF